jgi:protease-4
MRQFFITLLAVILGGFLFIFLLFMLLIGIGAAAGGAASSDKDSASAQTVLTLDLRGSFQDHSGAPSLFGDDPTNVVDTARALHRAKSDDKIKGLLIRTGYGMVPASAEELRLAMLDFKESGKFIIAHSQGFEATSIIPYMAVTAADEIWQQDTTGFATTGLYSESGFFGGVAEKYDAKPQFAQFYEYKNAANIYTKSDYTDAHREATTSYLTSLYDTSVAHIAADRNMSEANVKEVLNASPHSAETALEAGLVDKLGHYIDAKNAAKEKAGGDDAKFLSIKKYGPGLSVTGDVIAFIGGQGAVMMGESQDGSNPFSSGLSMGGDTLSKAFIKAAEDKKVKAIVFRVSSPGGSATASDQIHNAIEIAKDADKPIVISMGQYAASGGYYVAANADSIVAMPTTITGSIGVLGGKVAMEGTYAKVGYNVEGIAIGGPYASAYSGDEPWTQEQLKMFSDQMEDIYVDFTTLVAEGRNMPIERVREIAKGRVWTGEQAKELGLVDELGGIMKAIDVARELGGIEPDAKINLRKYPRPKSRSEQFEELFSVTAEASKEISALREITALPEVQALIKARAEADAMAKGEAQLSADIGEIK